MKAKAYQFSAQILIDVQASSYSAACRKLERTLRKDIAHWFKKAKKRKSKLKPIEVTQVKSSLVYTKETTFGLQPTKMKWLDLIK